ncbi:MAG: hypothetical protein NT077_04655 [Candidatus Taylorbacteria bacterium]|nr:hypothetical protein [Candidatus Taylorbacteria bacterium]
MEGWSVAVVRVVGLATVVVACFVRKVGEAIVAAGVEEKSKNETILSQSDGEEVTLSAYVNWAVETSSIPMITTTP